jgi:hypothetical protein
MSANCLHPGVIRSNLLPGWVRVLKPLVSRGMIDVEAGAVASLRLATDPALAGVSGVYFDEVGRPCKASSMAHDIGLQEALWAASERWVAAS